MKTKGKLEITESGNDLVIKGEFCEADDIYIAAIFHTQDYKANAQHIVTMWNNWDEMVDALGNVLDYVSVKADGEVIESKIEVILSKIEGKL